MDFLNHYSKDMSDQTKTMERFSVFKSKAREIIAFNKDKSNTWEMGINEWSDITDEEFNLKFPLLPQGQDCSATSAQSFNLGAEENLPKFKDWRDANVVPPVNSQGSCGSCWTFSTINTFESHYAIATGIKGDNMKRFSQQQLVDCAGAFDNNGCSGGLPSHAFTYIYYDGLMSLDDYPYTAKDELCKHNPKKVAAWNVGSMNITSGDEFSMKQVLAVKGPVAIAYQVVGDFRNYRKGVYSSTDCKNGPMDVNHAVTAVGYGVENGTPYWLVKNSWGETWGDQGYFKIEAFKNMCGVAVCNSFPVGVYPASS